MQLHNSCFPSLIRQSHLNAGQHLLPLAEELSETFTLYVPDRRGRSLSQYSGRNTLLKECDDIETLVTHTGAERSLDTMSAVS